MHRFPHRLILELGLPGEDPDPDASLLSSVQTLIEALLGPALEERGLRLKCPVAVLAPGMLYQDDALTLERDPHDPDTYVLHTRLCPPEAAGSPGSPHPLRFTLSPEVAHAYLTRPDPTLPREAGARIALHEGERWVQTFDPEGRRLSQTSLEEYAPAGSPPAWEAPSPTPRRASGSRRSRPLSP